ncbi:TonB-dependent receptor [Suttonella sp. R2A3]|uniref:TonB-dependent receptor domain-containing protein n=1 Tax=Suttonella sp. R2A3 TaxID=2908648 RepID=UPI001F44F54A|nr:TonB-dependent receptor [Suttonella sp. R2A3]UJF25373.1 TonB-dependent receptor [Suttonella sp. R2A3]
MYFLHHFTNKLTALVLATSMALSVLPALAQDVDKQAGVRDVNDEQTTRKILSLDDIVVLGANDTRGGAARDSKGYEDVYALDISTTYAGFEEVQRFKGSAPAEIFRGMIGVQSGDMRNSGAIDPNVRGVQGQGRVPVIIDGTEQALTVWRGYNGANNRNYLDPMLIGGLQVEKGPSMTRGVNGSVGGAVVINTIDIDDIVPEGENFALNFRFEGSNNTVKPRLPALAEGVDVLSDEFKPLYPNSARPNPLFFPLIDPDVIKTPHNGGRNKFGQDMAYRIAIGKRWESVDVMAALVHRNRGNYFAGSKGSELYSSNESRFSVKEDNTAKMARIYHPGDEVFNTSATTTSALAKVNWHPNDEHALQLGLRNTVSRYGEILPSRLDAFLNSVVNAKLYGVGAHKLPQWPQSKLHSMAANVEWRWRPANPYIDLNSNLWLTRTVTDTHTSGGWPRETMAETFFFAQLKQICVPGHPYYPSPYCAAFRDFPDMIPKINKTYRSSQTNATNTRLGLSISNKMNLNPKVDLTLGTNYQYEKLRSSDNWWYGRTQEFMDANAIGSSPAPLVSSMWNFRAHPREGHRQELNVNAKLDYRPNDWAELSAGVNFGYYRAFDDHLQRMKSEDNKGYRNYPWPETWSGSAWSPMLSGTLFFSDYSRLYGRIAQKARFPSMFESTIGFSAIPTLTSSSQKEGGWGDAVMNTTPLKPERTTSFELGYVHDLRQFFPSAQYADIKIAYYHNITKNIIDRDTRFRFRNMEKQTLSGAELQARYDSGHFFGDLGISRSIKNEVCDQKTAAILASYQEFSGGCVHGGYPYGYLQNTVPPKYTISLGLGGRFVDNDLTIGTRILHHSKPNKNREFLANYNNPLYWDKVTTVDAYLNYQFDDTTSVELTGTNLTDRYFLDPQSRTRNPAPGRTIKLTFSKTF